MLPLTDRADVYRTKAQPAVGPHVRGETKVLAGVPCLIVPMSNFDRQQAYSLESTHVAWFPRWCELLKEDQIRDGHRTDPFGDAATVVYVVNGRRRFTIGFRHRAYYVTERD